MLTVPLSSDGMLQKPSQHIHCLKTTQGFHWFNFRFRFHFLLQNPVHHFLSSHWSSSNGDILVLYLQMMKMMIKIGTTRLQHRWIFQMTLILEILLRQRTIKRTNTRNQKLILPSTKRGMLHRKSKWSNCKTCIPKRQYGNILLRLSNEMMFHGSSGSAHSRINWKRKRWT